MNFTKSSAYRPISVQHFGRPPYPKQPSLGFHRSTIVPAVLFQFGTATAPRTASSVLVSSNYIVHALALSVGNKLNLQFLVQELDNAKRQAEAEVLKMQQEAEAARAESAQQRREAVARAEEERDLALAREVEAREALQDERARSARQLKEAEEKLRAAQEDAGARIKSLQEVSFYPSVLGPRQNVIQQ